MAIHHSSFIPTIAPPAMLKGVTSGYWGEQEFTDLKDLKPQIVRLGTPPEATIRWTNNGQKVLYLYEADTNGSYNKGGVKAINAASWVSAAKAKIAANPDIYAFEVLNEPSGSWFWGEGAESQENAAAYANILKLLRQGLGQTTFPIIASCDGGHPGSLQWIERMKIADPNVLSYFDGGAVHPYGGNGTTPRAQSAEGRRAAIESTFNLIKKPIWVTEMGWPTILETGDSLKWTEAEQSTNVEKFLAWAKANSHVAAVTIYNYREGSPGYGLARQDDTKKPSWEAFKKA